MSESIGTSGSVPVGRLLRLAPAAVAAYELRYLITHLVRLCTGAGSGAIHLTAAPVSLALLFLLAAGTGLLLRESARGLSSRAAAVELSLRLLRSWLACSAGIGLLLVAVFGFSAVTAGGHTDTLAHAIGFGNWFAAGPALLVAGLLLALSLHGARWWLARVSAVSVVGRGGQTGLALSRRTTSFRAAGAPLRAGWSDRGPPRMAPTTT